MSEDVRQYLSDETNRAIDAAHERDRAPVMSNEVAAALLNGVMHDTFSWLEGHEYPT